MNKRNLLKKLDNDSIKHDGSILDFKMYIKMFLYAIELKENGIKSSDIK